ncbi:alpha/beta hydrolase fold domain-containing protein [Pedobacter sp. MC2016-24]|nr:alpha/beta hydrolase fold domain-containing protein [Pedobacter sp. MC2016-24]
MIKPEGWDQWGKESNRNTAYYAEYQNSGAGASTANRVKWSHQLTQQQAGEYTLDNIFRGWNPAAPVQNRTGLTGVRDTSFSTASAYRYLVNTIPDLKVVNEFKSPHVLEKRNQVYCTLGDRALHLDAFYPKSKKDNFHPAVLIVHGGGWRSGNREQHIPLAQRLAALGYACFTVEYRLSTEALYPAAVDDLKSAIRWMRLNYKQFNLDTSKVTILGFSAGGALAAFVGVTSPDKVQAIVDIDGTLSFVHPDSAEGDDRKSISAATNWFGYGKKENPALWKDASPLTHVGEKTPPILFLNSAVEWMHAGRDDFRAVLNKHGIYSEVHTFENAPHTFCLFEPWFEPTLRYIDGFLKKIYK